MSIAETRIKLRYISGLDYQVLAMEGFGYIGRAGDTSGTHLSPRTGNIYLVSYPRVTR